MCGLNGAQAPGAYLIETREESEELPDGVPFAAWRWRSTSIRFQHDLPLTRSATVDPAELDAALARDSAPVDIRLESAARRAHRVGKKAFFALARAEKLARNADGLRRKG